MKPKSALILFFAYFLYIFSLSEPIFAQQIEIVEDDEGIWLMDDNSPRFFYQTATKSLNGKCPRANYIHPLLDFDGDTLTYDFPTDHLHHRGIFWSWPQLYAGKERPANPWLCEGIEWKVENTGTKIINNNAIIESTVYWIITNKKSRYFEKAVMKENVIIRYKKLNLYFELELEITLIPLIDSLRLGGSDDEKGYGGFSARLRMPPYSKFNDKKEELMPEPTPIDAGGWVQITGVYPEGITKNYLLILMCDPEELPSFQGWILRKRASVQNPAFPGRDPIPLQKGRPFAFRNKIVVLSKNLHPTDIDLMHERFIKSDD